MRTNLIMLSAALCMLQACTAEGHETPDQTEEKVFFIDDFTSFDETVWTKESHEPGWVNQELQAYDPAAENRCRTVAGFLDDGRQQHGMAEVR